MDNSFNLQQTGVTVPGEELTRSPQFNDLIRACHEVQQDKRDPEDLLPLIEELKDTIASLSYTSAALKLTQPKTENLENEYSRLQELFEITVENLNTLELYTENRDEKFLEEPLENIRKAIAEIFEISDGMKEVEEKEEVYSKSLYINDLLRVGFGFVKGEYELEPFRVRYDAVRDIFDDSYSQIYALAELPPDTRALEENLPLLKEYLEYMREAFDELENFFYNEPTEDLSAVDTALGKIRYGSACIALVEERIAAEIAEKEEAKTKRVCPRCSEKTSIFEKYCQNCSTLLPPMPISEEKDEKIDLVASESGIQEKNDLKAVSPNVMRLYEAAYKVGKGEISKADFKAEIEWFEEIIEQTRKDMKDFTPVPEVMSDEEQEIFQQIDGVFEKGMKESEEGVAELKKYLDDEVLEHLVTGINMLIDASEKFHKIDVLGNKLQQKIMRQNKLSERQNA